MLPRHWGHVTSFKMAAILGAILDFTENEKLSKNIKSWKFFMLDMQNMT